MYRFKLDQIKALEGQGLINGVKSLTWAAYIEVKIKKNHLLTTSCGDAVVYDRSHHCDIQNQVCT